MIDLQLVTLAGKKLDQSVYEVVLPTVDGEIAVFPGHEPLITMLKDGVVMVRPTESSTDEQLEYFAVSGGVAEINQKRIKILVDEADRDEDIVEAEAEAALKRAEELRASASNQMELEKAHQLIDRHAVRLKVAGLRRRRRHN